MHGLERRKACLVAKSVEDELGSRPMGEYNVDAYRASLSEGARL